MRRPGGRERATLLGVLAAVGLFSALPMTASGSAANGPVPAPSLPPLPGGQPPIVPSPAPGKAAAPCQFRPLGRSEVRHVGAFQTQGAAISGFSVDPVDACHEYVTFVNQVQRSDDGGNTWLTTLDFRGIAGVNPPQLGAPVTPAGGTVYVFDRTGGNGVFGSTDHGATWQPRDQGLAAGGIGLSINVLAFAAHDPQAGYLLGQHGGVSVLYRTIDGGASWSVIAPPSTGLSTLALDPRNSNRVYVAGPQDPTNNQSPRFWESQDGGGSWTAHPAASGVIDQLVVTHPAQGEADANVLHVFAHSQAGWFRTLSDGNNWQGLGSTPDLTTTPAMTFDPNQEDQMVAAGVGTGSILVLLGTKDGFGGEDFVHDVPGAFSAVSLAADNGGDFFDMEVAGSVYNLFAFRLSAFEPPPPPPSALRLEKPVTSCTLPGPATLRPVTANGAPVPGQFMQPTQYLDGDLAFDGTYLDFTIDYTDDSGQAKASPTTYGQVYRIDPLTCLPAPGPPLQFVYIDDKGSPQHPIIDALTYDPRYTWPSGHVGALMGRSWSGTSDPRVKSGLAAGIYALDLLSPTVQELAFTIRCGTSGAFCSTDPNLLTYDFFRDKFWVLQYEETIGDWRPALLGLPARRGDPGVPVSTCMSRFHEPSNLAPADSPQNDWNISTWSVGADGVIYAQMENDKVVRRINANSCPESPADGFAHTPYSEGRDENDQMACDPISFGVGSPHALRGGVSVVWIRDVNIQGPKDKTTGALPPPRSDVSAYEIPGGYCPFPDTISLAQPVSGQVNTVVPVCATLKELNTEKSPLANQAITFDLAGNPVGTVQTDATGTACQQVQLPPKGQVLALTAKYAGTPAFLPAVATGSVTVLGVPPPPPPVPPQPALAGRLQQPPPPALIPQPVPAPQVQVQSQVQAQTQTQVQTGVATEEQEQTQVVTQSVDGKKNKQMLAVRRRPTTPIAALVAVQLGAGAMFGLGLLLRDRRPSVAFIRPVRRRRR